MYDSYRELLAELDKNTTRLMVEELAQENEVLKTENLQKDDLIAKQQQEMEKQRQELERQRQELEQLKRLLAQS